MSNLPLFADEMSQETRDFIHGLQKKEKQEQEKAVDGLTRPHEKATAQESKSEPQPKRPSAKETITTIREPLQRYIVKNTFTAFSAIARADERQRQQMEKQIEAEAKEAAEQAAEAVRERYKKQNPREWNESKKDKSFRELAASLRN